MLLDERFWSKVNKHGPRAGRLGRCWLWMATRNRADGYGYFRVGGQYVGAHRIAWGDVPEGMDVLHKCDNPPCVRRSHLFLGTNQINQLDSVSKLRHFSTRKTHCPARHPYNAANTYIDGRGWRHCRICKNAKLRAARAAA